MDETTKRAAQAKATLSDYFLVWLAELAPEPRSGQSLDLTQPIIHCSTWPVFNVAFLSQALLLKCFLSTLPSWGHSLASVDLTFTLKNCMVLFVQRCVLSPLHQGVHTWLRFQSMSVLIFNRSQ